MNIPWRKCAQERTLQFSLTRYWLLDTASSIRNKPMDGLFDGKQPDDLCLHRMSSNEETCRTIKSK